MRASRSRCRTTAARRARRGLGPLAPRITINGDRGERRAGRDASNTVTPSRTAPTPSSPPWTSASAIRTDTPANALTAVKITTLPGAGSLTNNGALVTAGRLRQRGRHRRRQARSSPRRPTPTGPATRASPSRCRTTAAPPTAAWTSIQPPNTMTIDVTAVNDAPAGANNTVTHQRRHRLHLRQRRLRLQRSDRHSGQRAAGGEDHDAAGQRAADRQRGAVTAGHFVSGADITAGKLVFTPAANANGAGYAELHLPGAGRRRHRQRRRRSRPARRTTMTINVTAVNDAPAGTNNTVTTLEDTAYTFAAADFGFSDPNDSPANTLAGGQDHDAARRRHPDQQRRRGDRRPVRHGWPTSAAASWCSRRRPTPTARATPASPSRCRTTAAPPTAASISIRPPNTMTINVTAVNDAPAGDRTTRVTTLRRHGLHVRQRPTSASAIRTTARPTRCWR